jgi:probable HAF family extracellular repeat protein
MKAKKIYLTASALLLAGTARAQYTFTTMPDVDGTYASYAQGIDGNTVVGYNANDGNYGYAYDITTGTYSPSGGPDGAAGSIVYGISGSDTVGGYSTGSGTAGYLDSGGSYTSISAPLGANGTYALGTYGGNVVGVYYDANNVDHGFSYISGSLTTLDDPDAGSGLYQGTTAYGISSSGSIVGYFTDSSSVSHGFIYSGGAFTTTLNDPNAGTAAGEGTYVFGISGSDIYGGYIGTNGFEHGYIFDGTTYETVDNPLGTNGSVTLGISGDNILEGYTDSSGVYHSSIGSLEPTPEPSAIVLTVLGGVAGVFLFHRPLRNNV